MMNIEEVKALAKKAEKKDGDNYEAAILWTLVGAMEDGTADVLAGFVRQFREMRLSSDGK